MDEPSSRNLIAEVTRSKNGSFLLNTPFFLVIAISGFLSTPALAQYPLPNEVSVGIGGVTDQSSSQPTAVADFGFAFVERDNLWDLALDLGFGPTSNAAPCQQIDGPLAPRTNCEDGFVLVGPRFRLVRDSDRVRRPFVHVLLGAYWQGSGLKNPEFLPGNFALQAGGGIDLRRSDSIHGLRLSGDYRRVFSGEHGKDQLRFVVAYFVGGRGRQPPPE